MMILTALLSGTAHAGSADGIDNELSLEMGAIRSPDQTMDVLTGTDALSSLGLRLGYGISPNIGVVASWHHSRHSAYLSVNSDTSYFDIDMDLTTNQLAMGPKVGIQITHWLRPYITVQGMGMLGKLQIDEDPREDEDALLKYTDLNWGGFAAAGLDLVPGEQGQRVHPALYLEMGYAKVFSLQFEDSTAGNDAIEIGDLDLQGFTVNTGLGIRF
jgi:hypothetical protein